MTLEVLASATVPDGSFGIADSSFVVVPNSGLNLVTVLDQGTNAVIGTISVHVGVIDAVRGYRALSFVNIFSYLARITSQR
jgi:DNA-binding beta-propeller fold protein YncE